MVVENYKLTRDKLGTGINGSVIKGNIFETFLKQFEKAEVQ